MTALPFVPWWHHPSHNYEGRHRGIYRYRDNSTAVFIGTRTFTLRRYEW